MDDIVVSMNNVTKAFNGVEVLKNVNFELRRGEVHALLGENGAGKSTLMKILQGVYSMDRKQVEVQEQTYMNSSGQVKEAKGQTYTVPAGQIKIEGQPVYYKTTQEARMHGIVMVFQEFSLIPTLTVAQNIFLTQEVRTGLGLLDDRACEQRTQALFDELGFDIDARTIVNKLSTGTQQLTEIAKALLSQKVRVLILDEPTSSLSHSETLVLFEAIERLKAQGIAIIYISHRMEEIFQVSDRITVLRDGKHIITADKSKLTLQQVIEHIVGGQAKDALTWQERTINRTDDPIMEVKELSCPPWYRPVNFCLYPGEVLGIAGLRGSGRTELLETLFGLRPIHSGDIYIWGRKVRLKQAGAAVAAGIALIPEDRRRQGLVLQHNLKDNFLLPVINLGRLTKSRSVIDDSRGEAAAEHFVELLRIRTNSIFSPVRILSGGNQQKVVLAKWLNTEPEIILLDEPTVGVDIGAKGEILDLIRQLTAEGKSVIIVSSELPELLAVSDRILILRQGSVTQSLDRREIGSEKELHHILQGA